MTVVDAEDWSSTSRHRVASQQQWFKFWNIFQFLFQFQFRFSFNFSSYLIDNTDSKMVSTVASSANTRRTSMRSLIAYSLELRSIERNIAMQLQLYNKNKFPWNLLVFDDYCTTSRARHRSQVRPSLCQILGLILTEVAIKTKNEKDDNEHEK